MPKPKRSKSKNDAKRYEISEVWRAVHLLIDFAAANEVLSAHGDRSEEFRTLRSHLNELIEAIYNFRVTMDTDTVLQSVGNRLISILEYEIQVQSSRHKMPWGQWITTTKASEHLRQVLFNLQEELQYDFNLRILHFSDDELEDIVRKITSPPQKEELQRGPQHYLYHRIKAAGLGAENTLRKYSKFKRHFEAEHWTEGFARTACALFWKRIAHAYYHAPSEGHDVAKAWIRSKFLQVKETSSKKTNKLQRKLLRQGWVSSRGSVSCDEKSMADTLAEAAQTHFLSKRKRMDKERRNEAIKAKRELNKKTVTNSAKAEKKRTQRSPLPRGK